MFQQKSTETVTLTRPQLQAILEIISQIGGVNRSEQPIGHWSESKSRQSRHYRNDKLMFTDYRENPSQEDRQVYNDNSHWVRLNDDLLTNDWDKYIEGNGRDSSLIVLRDSTPPLQLISPTSSNSSKDEMRADSVMTNDTSKESNHRRYARINDSEFDWNEYHLKQMKALEYSKALNEQHRENQRRKIEEQQKRLADEQRLEIKIEEQRIKMKRDFEREQKLLNDKRLTAERKREAVIAAIERTPIIKKKNFLVDNTIESQPVAAIKPQTRGKEISTQTEKHDFQSRDFGTQTDVQLLLHLLTEMNLISKSKSEETLSKDSTKTSKSVASNLQKKFRSNVNISEEKVNQKSNVWNKRKVIKTQPKGENKTNNFEGNRNEIMTQSLNEKQLKEKDDHHHVHNHVHDNVHNHVHDNIDRLRRQSINICSSDENINDKKNKRVMSSIDLKNKTHFLPQIKVQSNSRKKWLSQETFDPNFLKL